MSDSERPEALAFRDLAALVGKLTEELSAFRRRALVAEARAKELEHAGSAGHRADGAGGARDLEEDNAALRAKLDGATARTTEILERVHFLRQQAQAGVGGRGDR